MKLGLIFTTLVLMSSLPGGVFAAENSADLNFGPLIYDDYGRPICVWTGELLEGSKQTWQIPYSRDRLNMVQIGTLVAPMYYAMVGGDSDGDSLFEAYMYIKDDQGGWTFTYRIYENDGDDNYSQVFNAGQGMIPYAYGDQDDDGLPEVIGQNGGWINVWESPAPGHYATNMVWQSPPVVNVTGFTAVGDVDGDGQGEIIHSNNSFGSDNRLVIWENTRDNQYSEIYNQPIANSNTGEKAIADFDGDGLCEIALSSGGGQVIVVEATGNNSFVPVFQTNFGASNVYECEYADDMDGNGRPEFVVSGSSGAGWLTKIFEANGNNSYIVRQEFLINDNYFGLPGNAVGDLDGDGIDELVIQTAQALHIYKWDGQHWAFEQTIPENFGSILHGVETYDGNHNVGEEIFWLGLGDGGYWTNSTIILESDALSVPPDITVTLTPLNPPIIIPSSGGSFDFTIEIYNDEPDPMEFDVRVFVILPDSSEYTITQLNNLLIGAAATISRDRTQVVPANAPAGNYIYKAQVGELPLEVWDEDGFGWVKE